MAAGTRLESAAPEARSHWPALDGLRGVAIGMVLFFHVGLPVTANIAWGVFGVELFFVLSGFLITALLLREWKATSGVSLRRFFARRALRLFPALLVAIAAVLLFGALLAPHAAERHASLWGSITSITYTTDFAITLHGHDFSNPLAHTWSLAIEEHFYLLWPVLAFAVLRWKGRTAALFTALTLTVAGTIERFVLFALGTSVNRLYFAPDTRASALMLGCTLALALDRRPDLLKRWRRIITLLGLGFLAISIGMVQNRALVGWWLPVASLASAGAILGAVDGAPRWVFRILTLPPLVTMGRVSYGLYLWHVAVITLVHFYVPDIPGSLRLAMEIALFSAATALSWRYIEQPALRLKRHFEVERRQTAASPPAMLIT